MPPCWQLLPNGYNLGWSCAILDQIGTKLEPSGSKLSWGFVGQSWPQVEPCWLLGRCCADMKPRKLLPQWEPFFWVVDRSWKRPPTSWSCTIERLVHSMTSAPKLSRPRPRTSGADEFMCALSLSLFLCLFLFLPLSLSLSLALSLSLIYIYTYIYIYTDTYIYIYDIYICIYNTSIIPVLYIYVYIYVCVAAHVSPPRKQERSRQDLSIHVSMLEIYMEPLDVWRSL